MPFLNAIVRRPTNPAWGKPTRARDLTVEEIAEIEPVGSIVWQILHVDPKVMTLSAFSLAMNRSPQEVLNGLARLKKKYGVTLQFMTDDMEPFEHDGYKEGVL